MIDRIADLVVQQILLADISDVGAFRILGEQVIEGLVLGRPDILRDRLIPFVAVREHRIDVEDHAPEIEHPVLHHLADREAGMGDRRSEHLARADADVVGLGHVTNVGICRKGGKRGFRSAPRTAWDSFAQGMLVNPAAIG
jgi:hypothetical protein